MPQESRCTCSEGTDGEGHGGRCFPCRRAESPSGYRFCARPECFETTIGRLGELCFDCEEEEGQPYLEEGLQ